MKDSTARPEWSPEMGFAVELYFPYIGLYVHPGNGLSNLLLWEMSFVADAFDDGLVKTTPEALMHWTGVTVKRVVRHLEELVADGILTAYGPIKARTETSYRFLFHHDAVARMDYWVKHKIDWREERHEVRWGRAERRPKAAPTSSGNGLRFRVFERDGFRCRYCGRAAADGAVLQADHVYPASRGGRATMENLVTACFECNNGKRDRVLTSGEQEP